MTLKEKAGAKKLLTLLRNKIKVNNESYSLSKKETRRIKSLY